MKKTILSLIAHFAALQFSYAQWVNGTGTIYTTSDKIGIGITNPPNKLVIVGSGLVQNITNGTDQDLNFSVTAPGATDRYSLISPSTSTNLALGVSGAEKMRITTAGHVGIGTTTPDNPLTVVGNIKSSNLNSNGNTTRVGAGAGNNTMTGGGNTLLGNGPGSALTVGAFNTVIGWYAAGAMTTGHSNIILGTTNVSSTNRFTGQALTSGSHNIFMGNGAGSWTSTGEANVAIGHGALTGGNGSLNTAVGYNSGFFQTTGSNNVYLGREAGFSNTTGSANTFIGGETGRSNTTGTGLTFLGNNAGSASTDGLTNATAIGYNAQATTSNTLILGNGAKVGIGTSNPDEKLTVNGTIHSKEVKVDVSIPVPDYVFDVDYKLTHLDDLKVYINKNHHLPEIPSATQMEKEGINLSVMNTTLLKKVEELTLYLIQKDEQLKEQEKTNRLHQEQINELKKQLDIISKSMLNK